MKIFLADLLEHLWWHLWKIHSKGKNVNKFPKPYLKLQADICIWEAKLRGKY